MNIKSLVRDGVDLKEIIVEVSLLPGLPVMSLLGSADSALKACLPRIKAALVAQGFRWPRGKQVVVNLRSGDLQCEQPVELAIITGMLVASGQLEIQRLDKIYFGEINLSGEVFVPSVLQDCSFTFYMQTVSGPGLTRYQIENLQELAKPIEVRDEIVRLPFTRPAIPEVYFSEPAAELLTVVASGEHATMIAGSPGTGKTTWAEAVHKILGEPLEEEYRLAKKWWAQSGQVLSYRPWVSPHHSASALALLGGGVPPEPGEITRAHSGVLFLDEYLEFPARVQESLREPIEKGVVRLARRNQVKVFPTRFLLIAATNLCRCGKLSADMKQPCAVSLYRCLSYLWRLNGPMMDRFDIFTFTERWRGQREHSLEKIYEKVTKAIAFRLARGQEAPNGRLSLQELSAHLPKNLRRYLPKELGSDRREQSLLRVARTYADLEQGEKITVHNLAKAEALTFTSHKELSYLLT